MTRSTSLRTPGLVLYTTWQLTPESVQWGAGHRPNLVLNGPDPAAVIDHAAARLARFKCPTSVEIVDELPHSATGKVAKGKLRSG